ncbi:MAG: hypothetical protein Ct9H300mP27_02400 [Chloroflexota bacterium]|nr:MAG: hypothetical protein Ct9H300mP27_02400 [Chloroflexota bacterium]
MAQPAHKCPKAISGRTGPTGTITGVRTDFLNQVSDFHRGEVAYLSQNR